MSVGKKIKAINPVKATHPCCRIIEILLLKKLHIRFCLSIRVIKSLSIKKGGSFVKIRYEDKRAQEWLNVNRLQLPLRSFILNSNKLYLKYPKMSMIS